MKHLLFCLLIISLGAKAQDCRNYFYLTNNATIELKVYDKKGKESATQTMKVSDVKKSGGGYESTINTSMTDDKGKETMKSSGRYKCENGMLMADIRMSMPSEQMQAYEGPQATLNPAFLEYPNNMSAGQALKDADFNMDFEMKKGTGKINITFRETNRKVEKKETITTPAGTWEAWVITYDANFRAVMGGIGIPSSMKGKEWFVPNFGVVKTETYNKNGKLMGSTILNALTK